MSRSKNFSWIKFVLAVSMATALTTHWSHAGESSDATGTSGRLSISPLQPPLAYTVVRTTFEVTLGGEGLGEGGTIMLRWQKWRPALAFEIEDVQITCDNADAVYDLEVPLRTSWLRQREPLICKATLTKGGPLKPGTKVMFTASLTYPKQSNVLSKIFARVAAGPDGKPEPVEGEFVLHSTPGAAAEIRCIAEARPVAGKPGRVVVAVVDEYGNPARDFRGTVRLQCNTQTDLPAEYTFTKKNAGSRRFHARFPGGIASRIKVTCGNISAGSNPILPRRPDEPGIYFGDIHSHCHISPDGVGTPEHAYQYARDFYGLDFAALADHSPQGVYWEKEIEVANRHNVAGQFVTFLGIEWSQPANGHRNIYYRADTGPTLPVVLRSNMEPWWKFLDQKKIRALTVPHHSNTQSAAKRPSGKPFWGPTDFSVINHKYQRIIEICQIRGSFEVPGGPVPELRVVAKDFGSSAQTALAKGHRFGFIGSTDTHSGRTGTGAARCVIIGKDFSRKGLWDAMYNRSCYATSGKHILVFFTLNGNPMGSELVFPKTDMSRDVKWRVLGTGPVKRIDLLLNNKTIKSWSGNKRDEISGSFTFDEPLNETEWWYLRVIQEDTEMAWSSPIWVDSVDSAPVKTSSASKQ